MLELSLLLAGFVVYVGLCFGVGKLAETRGRSFVGFFLFSLLITPLLPGFLVLVLGEHSSKRVAREMRRQE